MKKQKFQPIHLASREAMTAAVNDYVREKIAFATRQLAMEKEIAEIQERYQRDLDEIGRRMGALEAGIQVWAQQHRDAEFPKDKKSIDLQLAVIGFRETPYRVEKVKSKDTWTDIAFRMACYQEKEGDAVVFNGEEYINIPAPEISKKLLLQDREKIPATVLKAVGIRFEFDENFYIDPKSEVLEGITKEAA